MASDSRTGGVQSIDRALSILEAVSESGDGITVAELTRRLGLPFSTVHRLTSHLAYRGYLEHDPLTRRYTLGMKVLLLRGRLLRTARLEDRGYPALRQLARLTGETSHLAVLHDGQVVYVRTAEGPGATLLYTPPGKQAPAHCTALGKAMLAHLDPDEVRRIVETRGLPAFTPNTITRLDQLLEQLERIRREGYATDSEESELGIRCVAAPIFGHWGGVVAAVSVAGPAGRLTVDRMPELARAVMATAAEISSRMGYAGVRDVLSQT